ncbi:phosphate acetyltransferase [Falsarthrobacter nasiphocae]|uniref:Phosphate acetyltransferase n=1 Tax=Falsarthrobacter nasiphocae TaxID=189863 RepID=A0AAE4C4I4_9MICC|nr:phosphate acetyltransferase [Falsarthrobacter nasiphocae]MDR6891381.1 phosphate acetyltransferase [Falsarthrobacter nasiphocae]
MTQGIFLDAMTPRAGKTLVALGLADSLIRRAETVGYFRPVHLTDSEDTDPTIRLMRQTFGEGNIVARGGVSLARCREILASGDHDELDTVALSVYSEMSRTCDVIIVDGTDLLAHNAATAEFDMNARIANNLGCSVLAVISGHMAGSVEDIVNAVEVTRSELHAAKADLLAIIVNRVSPELAEAAERAVPVGRRGGHVYVIPETPAVSQPTVQEVAEALELETEDVAVSLDRDVQAVKVAAMTVGNFLAQMGDGDFVIAPADRSDVVMATLASALSPTFPVPSGLLLSGGMETNAATQALIATAPFPVLRTKTDTFTAAQAVGSVQGALRAGEPRKIAAAMGLWSNRIDEKELLGRLELPRPVRRTPLRFLHELIEKARSDRRRVVLPEGEDARVLRAAEMIVRRDFCDLTILGPAERVRELAQSEGIDLVFTDSDDEPGVRLIDPATSPLREEYAAEYARLRAHKGVDHAQAMERMLDGSYFGTMMVQLGHVDGMVSGAAHTTANTIRPALEFVKTKEGVQIVSSVFFMLLEDRVLVYGDCAVNPNPDAAQLADIAAASAETAAQFGVDPKVAMLSYSTGGSGSGEDVDRVREATALLKEKHPEIVAEGPIQYDAAVDQSIAASKLPGSPVAGQATVFVFPDLNTGNNTYKAVQQSAGAVAVGPVLQGLRKPVNDLSRGCTVDDIVNTVAITAIQAQG